MEPTWVEITFALDPDDYRLLKKHAENLNQTVPTLLRRNIGDFLRRQNELIEKGIKASPNPGIRKNG